MLCGNEIHDGFVPTEFVTAKDYDAKVTDLQGHLDTVLERHDALVSQCAKLIEERDGLKRERDLLLRVELDYMAEVGDYMDHPENYPSMAAHGEWLRRQETK
jgi:hypothetical protein